MANQLAPKMVRTTLRRLAATGFVALMVTFTLPLFETSTASPGEEVPHVMEAGWPRDWITQQSTLSPPGEHTYRLALPLENATTIDQTALAFNVLIIWPVIFVLAAIRTRWAASTQSRPKPRQTQGQAGRR